ncbi:isoaspartyl peptidase/L-asparaginase family protein [Sphingomonas sp. RIT328]|uniref:isoaspartyl peptidase/L-asparaginase family protein n=1 Tax=Sphingomonas sp. RIT328 TaxID=1470591 RepID=UPI00044873D0|nr:isoaspartyl peptidase/L-asparaginase [Sphingomonas sp. RIT328]EZP49324.1 Asparaginase family protein [Sphingomonas sp. RIT328]
MTATPDWSLVLHGGAGSIERHRLTAAQDEGVRAALGLALDAGGAILADGGSALDAVEAAVRVLEEDPHFNAGRGAAFSRDGTIELDAAIMDGRSRAAGAVAGLTVTRSPVGLARRVMEASPHVLLSGAGAEAFAREQGIAAVDPGWFATDERRRQLDELLARNADAFDVDMKYGTVGAVARDRAGSLAAATSTGGVTGKRWGRIGDSPLIGAGTFADDRSVAVSCTGSGEYFIRIGVGHEIGARVRLSGESPQAAADAVMAEVRALGGTGGVIVTAPGGEVVWSFTTPGMYRARATAAGLREVAVYGDE